MRKPVVYVDMDGVLTDFNGSFERIKDQIPGEKKFHAAVKDFHIFETLNKMPNADKLLHLLFNDLDVSVAILSSMGSWNKEVADESKRQKEFWLDSNGIITPRYFVNAWSVKQKYAAPGRIMIDDRLDVIGTFTMAGGLGVHYEDSDWINMEYRIRKAVTAVQQMEEIYAPV
jgi:5'(3')-deoxyribonucleotidase